MKKIYICPYMVIYLKIDLYDVLRIKLCICLVLYVTQRKCILFIFNLTQNNNKIKVKVNLNLEKYCSKAVPLGKWCNCFWFYIISFVYRLYFVYRMFLFTNVLKSLLKKIPTTRILGQGHNISQR